MKKKILAVFAALAIMTVGSTALAAGSPVAGDTKQDTTVAAGQTADTTVQKPTESAASMATSTTITDTDVTVKAVADTTVTEAVTATGNILTDVAALGKVAGDEKITAAATNKDATVTAIVLSVVNLESTKTDATVTVKNSAIKADKTYVVLHYTATGWVTLPATVTKAGELTFKADNFSPFAIVELGVTVKDTTASTDKKDEAASPKTGETLPVAVLAMLVCAAGIAVCAKKEEI